MSPVSSALQPPKARLQALLSGVEALLSGVEALEAQVLQARPITVLRIARCGHPECGAAVPAELPTDALVIELGCQYAVPQIAMPEPEASKPRAEPQRVDAVIGEGISEERQRRAIRTIQLL